MRRNYCKNCSEEQQANCEIAKFLDRSRKLHLDFLFTSQMPAKPLKCNYCGKERSLSHPFMIIQNEAGVMKAVYVCPTCAARESIGDILVQVGIELAIELASIIDKMNFEKIYAEKKAKAVAQLGKESMNSIKRMYYENQV